MASIDWAVSLCNITPDTEVNYRGLRKPGLPSDPNFIPTGGYQGLWPSICFAYSWNEINPRRYVEFWTVDGARKYFTMGPGGGSKEKAQECAARWLAWNEATYGPKPADPFTVDVPGLTDIIKWPGFSDTKEVKRARAQRMASANSAVPGFLKWLPPVLTAIDNAQDMIYTGLALAWPLVKYVFPRLLGLWGIILTASDLLNVFT